MKKYIIAFLKVIGLYKTYKVPNGIKKNYIILNTEKKNKLEHLIKTYCKQDSYSSTESYLLDFNEQHIDRLTKFREQHIPFLIETIGLKNKKILEIGCGTGSSTIALQEQGAIVTGIDIDDKALNIAQERANIYGLNPTYIRLNATEINSLEEQNWDIIIFFASLEHMTPKERQLSLKAALSHLNKNGHIAIFGTPNRLWPEDTHTSLLPFYMWLQDEVAIEYARYSSRKEFSEISKGNIEKDYEHLYRWGRGVSYHEIELAFENSNNWTVISDLNSYLRRYSFIQKISYKSSSEYKYKKLLSIYGPKKLNKGFYESYLDIIIKPNHDKK